jgi:peptide/nickel transport system permease protein
LAPRKGIGGKENMTTYVIRRLLQGVVVLFFSSFLIYSILILSPGGPRDQIQQLKTQKIGGKQVNPQLIDYYTKLYGLDKPYPLNYFLWLFDPSKTSQTVYDAKNHPSTVPIGIDLFGVLKGDGVLTLDLGTSVQVDPKKPVIGLMGLRIGNTLALMGLSTLISILIALPIGIIAAIRQYSRLDYTVTTFSFIGLSMPTFWLGLMLIIVFAILAKQLHDQGWTWLPYLPTGDTTDNEAPGTFNVINRIYHLILPVIVLSFVNIAGLSRYVRSSMLEVLRQDYVRTAWAKGLQQRSVILKHALRNALIPVITILTLTIPTLFSGAIITETIFNYFGMGRLYFQAVTGLDIPLVMGFLLIDVVLIVGANILADVLYAFADPRIRYS